MSRAAKAIAMAMRMAGDTKGNVKDSKSNGDSNEGGR